MIQRQLWAAAAGGGESNSSSACPASSCSHRHSFVPARLLRMHQIRAGARHRHKHLHLANYAGTDDRWRAQRDGRQLRLLHRPAPADKTKSLARRQASIYFGTVPIGPEPGSDHVCVLKSRKVHLDALARQERQLGPEPVDTGQAQLLRAAPGQPGSTRSTTRRPTRRSTSPMLKPARHTDFRAMSQAMAESCKGVTYVMAVQLNAMNTYIGIWPDTEYPALWRLYDQNPPHRDTSDWYRRHQPHDPVRDDL